MRHRMNPGIRINWNLGSAALDLGARINNGHPTFKVDIVGDLKAEATLVYERSFDELYPGLRVGTQRLNNYRRRTTTETLTGCTIVAAKPLRNGHVALELSDGRTVIFFAAEDVHLRQVGSLRCAVDIADARCSGTWFLDEPTAKDRKVTGIDERKRQAATAAIVTPS